MPQPSWKSLIRWSTAVAIFVSVPAPALSQNTVAFTKHNLSLLGAAPASGTLLTGVTNYGEICVYCHTPHNSAAALNGPLWNRAAVAGPYVMYTSPTITTGAIAGTPGSQSLACLSCHDGTVALDVVINRPGTLTSSAGAQLMPAGAALAQDLTNDHPIAVSYTAAGVVNEFVALATVTSGATGLKFYGTDNKVECSTCHNVHNKEFVPFLRRSNTTSGLCLTCHIK